MPHAALHNLVIFIYKHLDKIRSCFYVSITSFAALAAMPSHQAARIDEPRAPGHTIQLGRSRFRCRWLELKIGVHWGAPAPALAVGSSGDSWCPDSDLLGAIATLRVESIVKQDIFQQIFESVKERQRHALLAKSPPVSPMPAPAEGDIRSRSLCTSLPKAL